MLANGLHFTKETPCRSYSSSFERNIMGCGVGDKSKIVRTASGKEITRRSFGRDWVLEGQARWFEDHLDSGAGLNSYNSLNTYRKKEPYGSSILQAGILGRAEELTGELKYRPYQRFTLWKLFEKQCQLFNSGSFIKNGIINLQNADFGINDLNLKLEENTYNCDFGGQFGVTDKGSLRSALVYYQYATQFHQPSGDINLLDKEGNEPAGFSFEQATDLGQDMLVSGDAWDNNSNNGYKITYTLANLPKASAHSYSLFLHTSVPKVIPEDKILTIEVNAPSPIMLSIMSDDPVFNAKNTFGVGNKTNHRWLEINGNGKYYFKSGEMAPKSLITFINDGLTAVQDIEFIVELNTRKIAEKGDQYISASCALGNDLFRWGGSFLPTTIFNWALTEKPELSTVLDYCQDTVNIPSQSIPVTNCTANFNSLVEQYPVTVRNDLTDCITNKFRESFSEITVHESPSSATGRNIYWIDESNQKIIP